MLSVELRSLNFIPQKVVSQKWLNTYLDHNRSTCIFKNSNNREVWKEGKSSLSHNTIILLPEIIRVNSLVSTFPPFKIHKNIDLLFNVSGIIPYMIFGNLFFFFPLSNVSWTPLHVNTCCEDFWTVSSTQAFQSLDALKWKKIWKIYINIINVAVNIFIWLSFYACPIISLS